MTGIRIGQILIEQGILSAEQVAHVLEVQRAVARPFGDLAERLYGIHPNAVETAWVEQYTRTTGVADLTELEIDPACASKINRRQAWQFHLLPLYRTGEHLVLATTAESLIRAVNFATRSLHEPVMFLIISRRQMSEALMERYPVPQFIAEFAESF